MAQGQKAEEAQKSLDKVVRASQSQSHPRRYFELHSDFHVYDGYERGSHRWAGSMPSESPRLLRLFFSFPPSATLKKKFLRKIVEKNCWTRERERGRSSTDSRARIEVFLFGFSILRNCTLITFPTTSKSPRERSSPGSWCWWSCENHVATFAWASNRTDGLPPPVRLCRAK